jgi:hypothetical protein
MDSIALVRVPQHLDERRSCAQKACVAAKRSDELRAERFLA